MVKMDDTFKVVKHSGLNTVESLDLTAVVRVSENVKRLIPRREIVTVLEGDVVDVDGEPWLNHSPFFGKRTREYVEKKRKESMAVPLEDALGIVKDYNARPGVSPMQMCLELKFWPGRTYTEQMVKLLRDYGMESRDVYFDSFFPHRLAQISLLTDHAFNLSYHAGGNLGPLKVGIPYSIRHDFITIPSKSSFGNPKGLVIYGAVGSPEELTKLAQRPQTIGAYLRFNESSGLRMLLSSVRDNARDRLTMFRTMLDEPSIPY